MLLPTGDETGVVCTEVDGDSLVKAKAQHAIASSANASATWPTMATLVTRWHNLAAPSAVVTN